MTSSLSAHALVRCTYTPEWRVGTSLHIRGREEKVQRKKEIPLFLSLQHSRKKNFLFLRSFFFYRHHRNVDLTLPLSSSRQENVLLPCGESRTLATSYTKDDLGLSMSNLLLQDIMGPRRDSRERDISQKKFDKMFQNQSAQTRGKQTHSKRTSTLPGCLPDRLSVRPTKMKK